MNYCKANILDLFSIEQMEKDCFSSEAFDRRLIKNLLVSPKSIAIKAITPSGKIIGNIIGSIRKERGRLLGRMLSLCVLEKYRKKGIATHLVQLLEEEFHSRGVETIRLEVSTRNETARRFYKRHGYQITTPVLDNYYRDGSDAFVMCKNL